MKYLIHTVGNVVLPQEKSYLVNASTEKKAQELAEEQFMAEYDCNGKIHISKARSVDLAVVTSIAGMIIAILLSFINWKAGHSTISIKPDLISSTIAVIIYSAFIIRVKGLQRMTGRIDFIFLILSVLLLSSFIQSILSSSEFKIPILGSYIDCRMLFILAMILSWMGMKILSVGCMAVIFICGFLKIIKLNEAMGNIWGTVYIISAAVGIISYLIIEPTVEEMLPDYGRFTQRTFAYFRRDFSETEKEVQVIGEKMKNYKKKTVSVTKNKYDEDTVDADFPTGQTHNVQETVKSDKKSMQ